MPQGQHLPQLATPTAVYGSGANDTEVAVNARAGANCGAADAKMIVDSGAASRQHRPSSFESSGPMFDTSEPAAVFSGRLLWQHLRDCFVLAESGIVLTSQALRQMVSQVHMGWPEGRATENGLSGIQIRMWQCLQRCY